VIDDERILEVLREKPLRLSTIQTKADPGVSAEVLRSALLRLRDMGKVKFNIHSGQWSVGGRDYD
jgi:DNA-binding HxlR family transcriptional regulator